MRAVAIVAPPSTRPHRISRRARHLRRVASATATTGIGVRHWRRVAPATATAVIGVRLWRREAAATAMDYAVRQLIPYDNKRYRRVALGRQDHGTYSMPSLSPCLSHNLSLSLSPHTRNLALSPTYTSSSLSFSLLLSHSHTHTHTHTNTYPLLSFSLANFFSGLLCACMPTSFCVCVCVYVYVCVCVSVCVCVCLSLYLWARVFSVCVLCVYVMSQQGCCIALFASRLCQQCCLRVRVSLSDS